MELEEEKGYTTNIITYPKEMGMVSNNEKNKKTYNYPLYVHAKGG
jgi:hypothetical protein